MLCEKQEFKQLDRFLEEIVKAIVEGLKTEIGNHVESITLVGSYAIGKISYQRPNINILLFLKPNHPAKTHLAIGRIIRRVGKKFSEKFLFRIDPFPFRFVFPIGEGEPEVTVNLNPFYMEEQNLVTFVGPNKTIKTPFGVAEVIMQGMKDTRKVLYGNDVLGGMDFSISHDAVIYSVPREVFLYDLILTRAPMTYDIDKDYDLLATEALEVGKTTLVLLTEVLLDNASLKKGRHLELNADKHKLLEFLKKSKIKGLAEWAETVISARDNFLEVKKDKAKVLALYEAAFNVMRTVKRLAIEEIIRRTDMGAN